MSSALSTEGASFTRREREIMDVLYRHGEVTARRILEGLSKGVAYSTVRTQLRVLKRQGQVRHKRVGVLCVYNPTVPGNAARRRAVHLIETFFGGSADRLIAAMSTSARRTPSEGAKD
jgi:predicted transcriptional regulator